LLHISDIEDCSNRKTTCSTGSVCFNLKNGYACIPKHETFSAGTLLQGNEKLCENMMH